MVSLSILFADCSWRFGSSLDQSYQSYGAYYDNMSQKLQFHHQPQNKVRWVKNEKEQNFKQEGRFLIACK